MCDDIKSTLDPLVAKTSREPLSVEHIYIGMPIPVRRCLAVAIEQEAEQLKDLVDDSRVLHNIPGPVRKPVAAISTNLSAQPTQQHPLFQTIRPLQRISYDIYAPQRSDMVPMLQLDKVDTHQPKHVSPKTRMCISFEVSSRKVTPMYDPRGMQQLRHGVASHRVPLGVACGEIGTD